MIYKHRFVAGQYPDGEWYARVILMPPANACYIYNKDVSGYGATRELAIQSLTEAVQDLEAQAKAARQALNEFLAEDAT